MALSGTTTACTWQKLDRSRSTRTLTPMPLLARYAMHSVQVMDRQTGTDAADIAVIGHSISAGPQLALRHHDMV